MRCCARACAFAALLLALAGTARAQPSSSVRFLDVPYLQQSEALCGGAAAAMVMRYWGATGVYAETFASLVDRAAGGIRGADLIRDLNARGWDARSFEGDPALVQARLSAGQPVIALVEDRPNVFHYVVIVAWVNGRVVYHDPARAPFRVAAEAPFLTAWRGGGHWALLALPPPSANRPIGSSDHRIDSSANRIGSSGHRIDSSCSTLVEAGVRAATGGDQAGALETLTAAADACPEDPAPWREMAGVYALKGSWKEAAAHARQAVRRDRDDAHAWRILATASYLTDDSIDALEAWNAVGEPTIDIVNVQGLEFMRHSVATAAMRLEPQTVLTSSALSAAVRRLADIPAAQVARVNYRPLENGRTAVDAVVIERPRSPLSVMGIAMTGLRALPDRELTVSAANPTGSGDLVTVGWRWWENRPRIGLSYAAPLSFGGVLQTDVFRDEQTYGVDRLREVRKGGSVALSDWTAANLHWQAGVGVDGWSSRTKTISLSGSVEQRLVRDRLSLQAGASRLDGEFSAWTATAGLEWRSTQRHEGSVFLGRVLFDYASERAPLALWPGAGLGHARPTLLRAHALLDDGVITGEMFGRRLYSGGVEWRRWMKPVKTVIRWAPAIFVDAARAERRLVTGEAGHVDAGAGLRLALPGSRVLRLDVAKGLRDGRTLVSIGWMR